MHIVNTVFGSARGGRWQVLVDYSRWLKEAGHEVTVVIGTKADEPTAELQAMKCNIFRVRNSGFYDPIAVYKLWRTLRKLHPDAVISHGGRSTTLFRRAKPKHLPLIAVNHSNNVKRSVGADIYFNISDQIEHLIRSLTDQGLHYRVINCPRDTATKPPRLSHTPPVQLSYMGQLIRRKGVDVLLKALAQLKSRNLQFHCLIAGSGEQREDLATLCHQLELDENVTFVGQVYKPVEFLAQSDIFCFPTLGEGFPISPIEAFAAGCAVIGTDDPGTAELLEHANLGLVVPRSSVEDFADALAQLIQNPAYRRTLAERAQRRYLEKYTPQRAKKRFLEALENSVYRYNRRVTGS